MCFLFCFLHHHHRQRLVWRRHQQGDGRRQSGGVRLGAANHQDQRSAGGLRSGLHDSVRRRDDQVAAIGRTAAPDAADGSRHGPTNDVDRGSADGVFVLKTKSHNKTNTTIPVTQLSTTLIIYACVHFCVHHYLTCASSAFLPVSRVSRGRTAQKYVFSARSHLHILCVFAQLPLITITTHKHIHSFIYMLIQG